MSFPKNSSAAVDDYLGTLPPSGQREYIEWIVTARREETRARRLEEAIAMLGEGRRRNERYR